MLIEIPVFKGEVPRADPKHLPPEHAQVATNADLSKGVIDPFYDLSSAKTLNTTDWRSIFPIRYGGAIFWLCSEEEMNVISLPVQDGKSRVCYTDGIRPKETDWELASNSGADTYGTPNTEYYIGPPKPVGSFGHKSIVAADKTEGDVIGTIAYVYTFITGWGYESEPSDPTSVFDISENQYVELSHFEIPVPSDYNIVGVRIYRTVTGNEGTDFQLIATIMKGGESDDYISDDEIINNDGVWEDRDTSDDEIVNDLDLGEAIVCENFVQPPNDLKGLINLPNGVSVGYRGKEVYLSEPYIHYGYPAAYSVTTDQDIKSISWYGTTVVVGTEGCPYKINGYDPKNVSIEKQPDPQSCLFTRAMVNGPRFVLYPSPDGLYMISDEGNRIVTEAMFTKEQWRDLLTDVLHYDKTIIAFLYDEKYYAFFEGTNEGFIINFKSDSQFYVKFEIDSDYSVYGGYVDLIDDSLYLLIEEDSTYYIKKWEGFVDIASQDDVLAEDEDTITTEAGNQLTTEGTDGDTTDYLVYQWKSKIYVTYNTFFSCMKIEGDFAENSIGTGSITSSDTAVTGHETSFTTELKSGYVIYDTILKEYREISSIESDTALTLVTAFSEDVEELTYYEDENGLYYEDEGGEKYHIPYVSFRYNTTMFNLYKDDSLHYTRAINSTNPFRIPSGRGRTWEIEIKGERKVVNIKMAQSMSELA
jgi:hypothetical protein